VKAALLIDNHKIELREVAEPMAQKGELRIKLKKIGICGSDTHLFQGHRKLTLPAIIGHEGIGLVDQLGVGVEGFKLNQRVAIEPNIPCGDCRFCKEGRGNICPHKKVIGVNVDGCFAEYICIPSGFCWPIPEAVSDQDAVMLEPLAVAHHALHSSRAKKGDSIAVVGLGAIGLLLTQLAIANGFRVWVAEPNENKISIAVNMGAQALPADKEGMESVLEKEEVTALFDCAGVAAATNLITSIAPRGSDIILIGLSENPASFVPLKIAREGISIKPSIIYDHPTDFRESLKMITEGLISPSRIISSTFGLDAIQEAMELASGGSQSKIIIEV
jgi:L-iditol 2-dehydrogenase